MSKQPWTDPSDSPVIEQSIHDYVVSIFRQVEGPAGDVEIVPISQGAEATRGWDSAVKEAVPLYFQYKLPEFTARPESSQPDVFSQRRQWNFDDSAGLFHFRLRKKAPTAPSSQHQLLCDLAATGERVYYVSTTFIDARVLRRRGQLIGGEPYYDSRMRVRYVDRIVVELAPQFQGLICIPPCSAVDDPPEAHQFFFNDQREVSLHSEPMVVDSLDLDSVITDQLSLVVRGGGVTSRSVEEYVGRVLNILGGDSQENQSTRDIRSYYLDLLSNQQGEGHLMRQMRALAKTIKNLYGVHMLLTLRLNGSHE